MLRLVLLERLIAIAVILSPIFPFHGHAQIPIADDVIYSQDFNTLGTSSSETWTNNGTLLGWYAAGEDESDANPATPPIPFFFTAYRGGSGTSSTGRLYSYGNSADRALGALNQDDNLGSIAYGVHFQNTSAAEIRSFTVSMRVEQWRRTQTSTKSHQRIQVGYAIGTPAITLTPTWMLDGTQFTDIPEAYLINDDTTTLAASSNLDGNIAPNYHTITATVPISIQAGQHFFLRFLDENASGADVALGVDDLTITFSDSEQDRITAVSGSTVFAYIDMGMNLDIPDVGSPYTYHVPSNTDMTSWELILSHFFQGNWDQVDAPAAAYGYVLTNYTQEGTGNSYYILRKTNLSQFFWGTYVKAVTPTNSTMVLQAPHAIDDQYTGRQSAAAFQLTGAAHLFIAGAGRCLSNEFSPCVGQTKTCSLAQPRVDEDYRMSDPAHVTQSIFHLATVVLSQVYTSTVFIQLHGFSSGHPKEFYISCGTMDGYQKSVPDHSVMMRERLKLWAPVWDIQIPHVDNDEELGARDNPQGRFLNLYTPSLNFCENEIDPVTVTNRFLHIEQYNDFRKAPSNYVPFATALSNVINGNEYVRQIRISDVSTDYVQNFDGLPAGYNGSAIHTWGNNLHIPGVYSVRGVVGLFSNYSIGDGSASTAGLYSFGEAGSSDRALGSLSDGTTGKIAYGFLFRNDTGAPIYGVDLTYNAEQWRKVNGQTQNVKLSYAIANTIDVTSNGLLNDALFTNVPAGNLISTQSSGTGAVNGNEASATTLISNLVIPLLLGNGQELFIRFVDENDNGTGADVAMALDNFTVSFSAVPLPITWRYFEVEKSGRYAILKWEADNEKDCGHYEVQRSPDGKHFESISTLSCQNKISTNSYEFRDFLPLRCPLVYYRVCQYDTDGAKTYSQVRVIQQRIRPEPMITYEAGALVIQTPQDEKPKFITVIDPMGRQLAQGVPSNEGYNQYQLDCMLPVNQLLIVRIQFAHDTYTTRIRTR